MSLTHPVPKTDDRFDDWIFLLWKLVNTPSSGTTETNHAALGNLNSTNYAHLTTTQLTNLTTGLNSTIHYHASDRDRANHTGTQPAATISDFATAVQNGKRLRAFAVAALPAGIIGDCMLANDLLAPAFLAAAVGGGAVVGPVFYNGVAWIVG